tara:strand:+ start:6920 stop:7429 length:510 start_codon:yes stop_codon:yes gene_type:complete
LTVVEGIMVLGIILEEMKKEYTDRVIAIITNSMNENEGRWAKETLEFHYSCQENGKHDGRLYYIAKLDGKVVGITGLHRYIWGPEDVAWLGWFTVDSEFQRLGIGHEMMERTCEIAKQKRFRKILIETYSSDDFLKGRNFYEKFGFKRVGQIKDYIEDGTDMIVYGRNL